MRKLHPLLLLLGLCAIAARAAADGPLAVELLQPAAGQPLVGGASAVLEWSPAAGGALEPGVAEWEAFLSLDDGATYPFRITPHLDRDLRRVTWEVPPLPTHEARLLLRFGDESEEVGWQAEGRFTILPPPPGTPLGASRRVALRGEAARPGEAGVVSWVEGPRRGGSWRRVVSDLPELLASRLALHGSPLAGLQGAEESHSVPAPPLPSWRPAAAARRAPGVRAGPATTAPQIPILLQTARRNE